MRPLVVVLILLLAGCAALSQEDLAQACQLYYTVKVVTDWVPHPAVSSAARVIEGYVDPVCRTLQARDANTAEWVRQNAIVMEDLEARVPP